VAIVASHLRTQSKNGVNECTYAGRPVTGETRMERSWHFHSREPPPHRADPPNPRACGSGWPTKWLADQTFSHLQAVVCHPSQKLFTEADDQEQPDRADGRSPGMREHYNNVRFSSLINRALDVGPRSSADFIKVSSHPLIPFRSTLLEAAQPSRTATPALRPLAGRQGTQASVRLAALAKPF
jgi:hypothetical protein